MILSFGLYLSRLVRTSGAGGRKNPSALFLCALTSVKIAAMFMRKSSPWRGPGRRQSDRIFTKPDKGAKRFDWLESQDGACNGPRLHQLCFQSMNDKIFCVRKKPIYDTQKAEANDNQPFMERHPLQRLAA